MAPRSRRELAPADASAPSTPCRFANVAKPPFSTVIHASGRPVDPTVRNRREQGGATAPHTCRLAAQGKAARIASKQAERRIAMDVVTPKGAQTADTHSHLVRPDGM